MTTSRGRHSTYSTETRLRGCWILWLLVILLLLEVLLLLLVVYLWWRKLNSLNWFGVDLLQLVLIERESNSRLTRLSLLLRLCFSVFAQNLSWLGIANYMEIIIATRRFIDKYLSWLCLHIASSRSSSRECSLYWCGWWLQRWDLRHFWWRNLLKTLILWCIWWEWNNNFIGELRCCWRKGLKLFWWSIQLRSCCLMKALLMGVLRNERSWREITRRSINLCRS